MKYSKWLFSFFRIIKFKLIYGKKFSCCLLPRPAFVGKNVAIRIGKEGKVSIGAGTYISEYTLIEALDNAIVEIGENCFINRFNVVVARNRIHIGDYCMFGNNVSIYDHNHGYLEKNKPIKLQEYDIGTVNIQDDVWLAANVVCLKKTDIMEHVVVAANSVVNKKLEGNAVYGGQRSEKIKEI